MRTAILVAALALVPVVGCASPAATDATCGHVVLDHPVLVLEHGDQTSALARLEGGCLNEAASDPVLGQDQWLLDAHGKPFVGVNTDGSLRAIDAEHLAITATFDVYPDQHAASNAPHSIYGVDVDADGKLWISRDDVASMAVLDAGGAMSAAVTLASLDPMFGNPRMNGVRVDGGTALVALGFLATPFATPHADQAWRVGAIARVDRVTHAVVSTIDLVGHNPVHKLVPTDASGKVVIVATPGVHDQADQLDGIDRVDLDAGTATQILSETEKGVGGSIDEVVWASGTEAYAIVLGPESGLNPTKVIAFDPSKPRDERWLKDLARAPYYEDNVNGQAYVHVGLALDGDFVLVGDQTSGSERIRVFSRATGEEQAPIPTTNGAPWGILTIAP